MLQRWQKEWQFLLRIFLFFLFLTTIFRIVFLGTFYWEWIEAGVLQGLASLWYGMRLSLKTALHPMIFLFVFCSIPQVLLKEHRWLERWRKCWVFLWILFFVGLDFAKYPYYHNFNSGFDISIFLGLHEDFWTLVWTVDQEFPILWMLIGIIGVSAGFFLIWLKIDEIPYWPMPHFQKKKSLILYQVALICFLAFIGVSAGNGGSPLNDWAFRLKNSAVLENDTLNEAIVDDVQGLYRAWTEYKWLSGAAQAKTPPEDMKKILEYLNPDIKIPGSDFVPDYSQRIAQGAVIKKPKKIFIIVAESYAQWPLRKEYQPYHLADGMREVAEAPDGAWLQTILTNGGSTISAITAVVTGMAEGGQVTPYQLETHRAAFETSLAPQMQKLGYRTYFWYGGPSSWMGIKKMAISQGFSDFYGAGEIGLGATENRWGTSDKEFLAAAANQISQMDTPSVHVLLTISNHSPYTIDLEKEGFDAQRVANLLTPKELDDEELLTAMGHQWYSDREISKFIRQMKQEEPDSLFIFVGDHGSRTMYLDSSEGIYNEQAVPLIFSGSGISKNLFAPGTAGGQIQIIPTLIELIAPKGFLYYSIMPSLTRDSFCGVNAGYWMEATTIGRRSDGHTEQYRDSDSRVNLTGRNLQWEEAVLAYSRWRVTKGERIQ